MDTRGGGNGSVIDRSDASIPAVGCSVARGHRGIRGRAGQRNPLQVFTRGGPRVGPRYEALRVQQWIAWITGQRDWVHVGVIARGVGMRSDRLLALLRRHEIPRRYDHRNRALVSLSSLPRILDILLASSHPATSGSRRAKSPSTTRFRQHQRSQVSDFNVD